MKTFIAAMTTVFIVAGSALAGATEDKLIAMENAWAAGIVKKDTTPISTSLADDWVGQGDSPVRFTKSTLIEQVKSGKMVFKSVTLHDIKVRVIGKTAIVQGYDDEKSFYGKEDTSGTYSWTDVFENRGGKWVVVAGQITKVKK